MLLLCVIGALMGYLKFNLHPAKVFMGDTGSLALGGLLAATAMVTKQELLLIVIGGRVRHRGALGHHPGILL